MLNQLPKPHHQNQFQSAVTKVKDDNSINLSNLKLLIVEDNLSERLYIEQVLISFGANVTVSANASQALTMHNKSPFDLVISDWRMPGMTGPELCKKLKQTPQPPYIILLTGNNLLSHNIQGIESGADDFMTKPFVPAALKVHLVAASRLIAMQHKLASQNAALNQALVKEQLLTEQISQDVASAAKLQQSLLPQKKLRHSNWQIDSYFQPATTLAGDIFQCIELDKHHLGIYLLDVAGHGIAPAMQGFTLAQQINSFKETWLTLGPAALLNKLANQYRDPEGLGRFSTLILATLETKTGKVRITNAGHPMPLIFKDGTWQILTLASGLPLGIMPAGRSSNKYPFQYQEHNLRLKPNERLLLYSDGLYEAHHPKWGQFGQARLTALCQSAAELNPNALIHHLSHSLNLWQQYQAQDDISIMSLSAPEVIL